MRSAMAYIDDGASQTVFVPEQEDHQRIFILLYSMEIVNSRGEFKLQINFTPTGLIFREALVPWRLYTRTINNRTYLIYIILCTLYKDYFMNKYYIRQRYIIIPANNVFFVVCIWINK